MIDYITVVNDFNEKIIPDVGVAELGVEVFWEYNNLKIVKSVQDRNLGLNACLSPSKEEVVIVYNKLLDIESPFGASIFNLDGTIKVHLVYPKLVSEIYKSYESKVGVEKAKKSINFLWPFLVNYENRKLFTMCIGFDYDWYEIRQLDTKSGEFGLCVGVSRI